MCGTFLYRLLCRLGAGKEKKEDGQIIENGPKSTEENTEAKKADTESAGSNDAPTDIVQDSPDKEASGVAVISEVLSPSSQASPVGEESKEKSEQKVESSPTETVEAKIETESSEKAEVPKPPVETEVKSDPPVETKPEIPTTLEVKQEIPVAEASKPETPVAEAPKPETPVAEAPKPETPVAEAPKPETPVAEEKPKVETPITEEPKSVTPVAEELKVETSVTEEPNPEVPAAEESKAESPVAVEPKAETPVSEAVKENKVESPVDKVDIPQSPTESLPAKDSEPVEEEIKPTSPTEVNNANEVKQDSPVENEKNDVSPAEEKAPAMTNGGVNGIEHEESAVTVNGQEENDQTEVATLIWKKGGAQVAVSGDFNKWEDQCILQKQDDIFCTKIKLSKGTHHLKYIVDGVETVDDSQPTVELDGHGQVNVLTV